MRYLSLIEILVLHRAIVDSSGGAPGIRDLGALQSAVTQPRLTFGDTDLYPDLVSKATALCFSLVMNHPFVDGNKRIGHAAMETLLTLNDFEITADTDEQEPLMLDLAAGLVTREELFTWLRQHIADLQHPEP